MNHILTTLKTDNPWLADIKLKEEPRWLCRRDTINTKRHSSLVITLDDKSTQKSILEHKFIFGWGHPRRIKEYLDTKPTQQCLKYWSLTHNTSTCTSPYKCRRCGNSHHE
jgi:hypothetical protein